MLKKAFDNAKIKKINYAKDRKLSKHYHLQARFRFPTGIQRAPEIGPLQANWQVSTNVKSDISIFNIFLPLKQVRTIAACEGQSLTSPERTIEKRKHRIICEKKSSKNIPWIILQPSLVCAVRALYFRLKSSYIGISCIVCPDHTT